MSAMTDAELIGYCELHCKTERALFVGSHVNRMIKLAGSPDSFVASVNPHDWYSLHDEMEELCKLAGTRHANQA